MKSHLQNKVFSQAAEMTHIRRKEEKWKNRARAARLRQKEHAEVRHEQAVNYAEANFWSLRNHRTGMKFIARHDHLAYGCMRNVPYAKMENICYGSCKGFGSSEPQWELIGKTVQRFSKDETRPQDFMQRFAEWLTEAKAWYEGNPMRIAEAMTARDNLRVQRANDPVYQQAKLERHMIAMEAGKQAHERMDKALAGLS